MPIKKALLFSLFLVPIISGILVSTHLGLLILLPHTKTNTVFTIANGEGFASINHRLYKNELISNPRLFHYWCKFKGSMGNFKKGSYEIPENLNMLEVIEILQSGKSLLKKFTLVEGKNIFELASSLVQNQIINDQHSFIKEAKDKNHLRIINFPFNEDEFDQLDRIEGFLFPETYLFSPETSNTEIIVTMLNEFQKKIEPLNFNNAPLQLTPFQVITLASIVEKETGAKWERPRIAGVYLNRLKKKMRLQADPTTIYGKWESFDGNLRKKDLLEVTDYNTYKINGLPKGPIANPSLEAIEAVLNPETHNYLYFVSKNDGTHIFSENYQQHLDAIQVWQLNKKARENKSWRDLKQ